MIQTFLGAALLLVGSAVVDAQSVGADGCLRLLGSVACPAFQYAYIHPSNLSNAWPWLAGVTTVSQLDVAALNYFVDPNQWQQTKFINQLGCTNASGTVIQYERSRLCSNWVNSQWGRGCTANYNGTSAATSQKMLCQSTCLQYAGSARNIVNSTACPGADITNGGREATLLKDYVDCTDWMTLTTNDTATCLLGEANEGNCGFATSSTQLCDYCRGSNPDSCCYNSNTDVSVCGYTLAARPTTSSSMSPSSSASTASASASAAAAGAGTGNGTSFSNGQLAGIIVGSVLGGLLLLALLLLLLCLRRRKRDRSNRNPRHSSSSSFAPGATSTPGAFSSMFSASSPRPNSSEKGLIGNSRAAGVSSPTMVGGETLYGSQHNKSVDSAGLLGNGGSSGPSPSPGLMSGLGIATAGAGAGAAGGALAAGAGAGGNTAGMRTSGIVLPRVRDENQGPDKWIETGAEVTVLWPYTATLPDELDLRPGMKIKVLRLYDDAWGTGVVVDGTGADANRQGAFPVVCVSEGSSLGSSGGSRSSTASH